jgi:hypothetical protein
MKELQRILKTRNAGARGPTVKLLIILLWLISTTTACDFLVDDGAPSTPSEPPPAPGPDPGPDPGPVSPELTRAPYLQSLGTSSVVVAFRTLDAVAAVVDYGTTLDYGASVTGPVSEIHDIELHNLVPGQRYYYRVRAGSETLAAGAAYAFATDAGRADTHFSFFATADIGKSGGDQEVTAQRILQTTPRPEFGILAGDIIYPDGEASDYDANLMQPWADLLSVMPVWPALGNHDWHVDPETNFCAQWVLPNNEHYYSFDRGNAHFIALDTAEGQIYDRTNQVAWLRSDLQAHRDAAWTFVFYHHPGYTCTYKGYDDDVIGSFHPVFDEFGVDVVFMGHAHTYERMYPMRGSDTPLDVSQDPNYTNPSGTIYIISGAGADPKSDTTPDCAINAVAIDDTVLFSHVEVNGNTVRIRAIVSATGAVVDEITITKTGL